MKATSLETETKNGHNRTYSSTLNKLSAFNYNPQQYYNVNFIHHVSSTDDFVASQTTNKYNQLSTEVDKVCDNTRRSRQTNQWDETHLYRPNEVLKRDLSVPPINGRDRRYIEDNMCTQYSHGGRQYSVDGDLDTRHDSNGDGLDVYDSVMGSVSLTPPPVHIVKEHANKKVIIRPLAFRPLQSDRFPNTVTSSPTKAPGLPKVRSIHARRISPPPIPAHTGRVPLKAHLGRVQSLKSGDSSGYYSSRTVCTANGNTSSTDISPTFDDNGSMIDCSLTGEIYANTTDMIDDYQHTGEADQEAFVTRSSLELEIAIERERNKTLESALSKSSSKLINAESQINELKMRLSHKSSEVSNTMDSLTAFKRSLEHQSKKSHNLEKSIQSLQSMKFDRCKESVTKEITTQTNTYNDDHVTNRLLEQFEDERRVWLDEKLKVLTYQKQMESNMQKLLAKCHRMESQVAPLKALVKECRCQHHDHEKSSQHSADSSGRSHVANISRVENTEHQASF